MTTPTDKPKTRSYRLSDAHCGKLDEIADMLPRAERNRTAAIRYLIEIADKQLFPPAAEPEPKKKGR